MYICICNAITEKQLEEAKKTAKTFNEICRQLGLGSDCGSCIAEALDEYKKSKVTQKESS